MPPGLAHSFAAQIDAIKVKVVSSRMGLPSPIVSAVTPRYNKHKCSDSRDPHMTPHHLDRVRAICMALPETSERLSHSEPTFFVHKKVFAMFADNHHNDGRIAVWLPAAPGVQEALIADSPALFFRPPYVGHRGWIGIMLAEISDADLTFHIHAGWQHVAPKTLKLRVINPDGNAKP